MFPRSKVFCKRGTFVYGTNLREHELGPKTRLTGAVHSKEDTYRGSGAGLEIHPTEKAGLHDSFGGKGPEVDGRCLRTAPVDEERRAAAHDYPAGGEAGCARKTVGAGGAAAEGTTGSDDVTLQRGPHPGRQLLRAQPPALRE